MADVEFLPLGIHVNGANGEVKVLYQVLVETEAVQKMAVGQGETTLASPEIQEISTQLIEAVTKEIHKSMGLTTDDDDDWLSDDVAHPDDLEDPL